MPMKKRSPGDLQEAGLDRSRGKSTGFSPHVAILGEYPVAALRI